jgi:hypothetical protein
MTPTRLVYLLAASHSGSTLTAFLLASHPAICTAGELKLTNLGDVGRYRCSCGIEIERCPFWGAVRDRLEAAGHRFDLARPGTDFAAGASPWVRRLLLPLHRGPALEWLRDLALHLDPSWPGWKARVQSANASLARALSEITGRPVVVDQDRHPPHLLQNPALDVRWCASFATAERWLSPTRSRAIRRRRRRTARGGGSGPPGTPDRRRQPPGNGESNEEADSVLRRVPRERWVEVRYEAVCADPRQALRPAFECIGVDVDAPISLKAGTHHVVGNGMRLDATREVRLDERWKTALTSEDLAMFERVSGVYNRQLGYR